MNGRVCSFDEWNFAPAPFTIIIINIFFSKIIYFFCKFTTVWSACVQFQKRSRKHRLIILTGVCTNACYLTYVCTNMPNKTPFFLAGFKTRHVYAYREGIIDLTRTLFDI